MNDFKLTHNVIYIYIYTAGESIIWDAVIQVDSERWDVTQYTWSKYIIKSHPVFSDRAKKGLIPCSV